MERKLNKFYVGIPHTRQVGFMDHLEYDIRPPDLSQSNLVSV